MWVQLFSSMKSFSLIQSKNNNSISFQFKNNSSISFQFSSNQFLILLPLWQRVTIRKRFPHWCDGEDELKVWVWLAILNPVCACARPHTANQSSLRPSFKPSKKPDQNRCGLVLIKSPSFFVLRFSTAKAAFSLFSLLIKHSSFSPISPLLQRNWNAAFCVTSPLKGQWH